MMIGKIIKKLFKNNDEPDIDLFDEKPERKANQIDWSLRPSNFPYFSEYLCAAGLADLADFLKTLDGKKSKFEYNDSIGIILYKGDDTSELQYPIGIVVWQCDNPKKCVYIFPDVKIDGNRAYLSTNDDYARIGMMPIDFFTPSNLKGVLDQILYVIDSKKYELNQAKKQALINKIRNI